MAGAADVIRVARGELGARSGSRYGAINNRPWCSYFIRWCAFQAGVRAHVIPKKPWCDDLRQYYIRDRLYFPKRGYTPVPGDIVCFHWGDAEDPYAHVQHVGLVCEVTETTITTIEGNAGLDGRVRELRYPRTAGAILGYCHPLYESVSEYGIRVESTASARENPALYTQVAVLEARPTVERRPSDGKLVPTVAKSGILSVAIDGFSATVLAGARLTQTKNRASVFTFEILPEFDFFEGSRVRAAVGEDVVFSGYVFTKTRDEDGIIRVTAYDSLRYFKNRDTYIYEGKTASELFCAVCRDHGLTNIRAEESRVKLPYRVEDNKPLFDILAHAMAETERAGERFLLRDEDGCVAFLRENASGVVLNESNIVSFAYTSSIDGSYNRVKAITEGDTVRTVTLVQDTDAIHRYGLLQTVLRQSETDLEAAKALLESKCGVRRNLKLTVLGDIRLKAGDTAVVRGVWGDVTLDNTFTIHSVTHTWDGRDHTATVVLEGGDFDA